ncbi:MAG: nuclear transport factor 2 family protein [Nostocoides sp.]
MIDQSNVPLLAARLRRYCFAYTASHDPTVCDDIMVEDYVLHMGEFDIRGRDANYKPAAEKQYRQFPGLGMSVHDLLVTPTRAALHFSEYGRSVLTGTSAVWNGISLYHWDGDRLTDCRVEQDYFARRRQLESGTPNAILPPELDPWTAPVEVPDPKVEAVTREWLLDGGLARLALGSLDDEAVAQPGRIQLDSPHADILDCFSGQDRAAFHARLTGTIATWVNGSADMIGAPAVVYYTGFTGVVDGEVIQARAISDRLAAERRVKAARSS